MALLDIYDKSNVTGFELWVPAQYLQRSERVSTGGWLSMELRLPHPILAEQASMCQHASKTIFLPVDDAARRARKRVAAAPGR